MENYDNILLTYRERLSLFAMRFTQKMPESRIKNSYEILLNYGLIVPNYNKLDDMGQSTSDGTYRLSEKLIRYRIFLRRDRFHRYITPFTVSAVTTTAIYMLERWLLPELLNWVLGHFLCPGLPI